MGVVERAIELRTPVDDAPVDGRTDRDAGGPVLGGERQLQRADVHVAHRDQPSLLDRSAACLAVLKSYVSKQHTAPQIEFLAVRQDFDRSLIEPVLIADTKLKRKPVREIDEVLVLDHPTGNFSAHAVVAAGEVGPWIVSVIRPCPGRCPARREIAIAQSAQGFADSLPRWIEPFIHQRPR